MSINFRKGLFRLWLVLSLVWPVVIIFVLGAENSTFIERNGDKGRIIVWLFMLVPPVVVFLFGHVIAWVVRGFSATKNLT